MAFKTDVQATRSALQSVDTTLSADITATQDYIPVASTANFSTSVVAEIESTNEVVSFNDISENLLTNSENIVPGTGAWTSTRTTVTKGVTAPDGSSNASSVIPTVDNNTHRLDAYLTSGGSGTNNGLMVTGQTYTASIFAKAAGYDFMNLTIDETSNVPLSNTAVFNLSNGTIASTGAGITSSISDEGDGWYRCSITRAFTMKNDPFSNRVLIGVMTSALTVIYTGDTTSGIHVWGGQLEKSSSLSTYLPTTTSALVGLTGVTRGVNGTTAQAASSGDSIQQLPYALSSVDMPVRLKGVSISSDGTGAGRLTLCDNNGDTLCDIDIPDGKIYTLFLPEEGIVFPNGVFVSNTINVTGYTVYTSKYSGPNLT